MRTALYTMLLALAALPGIAVEPFLEIQAAPPQLPYQRAMTYTVRMIAGPNATCEFPDLTADAKQVEVRRLACENELINEQERHITQRYVLDPIFPGRYRIPALRITWKEGETEGALETPPLVFVARELSEAEQTALAESAGMTAPAAVLPPSRVSTALWVGALSVLLLLCSGGGLLFWLRRRQEAYVAPPLPAWTSALHRLRELQQRDLPGAGRIDAYYVDLSSILRYYIEDRFFIHAPEQTTPEFLEAAGGHGVFTAEQQAFLASFLHQCDRVKFARLQPGLDDMNAHFKEVKLFIQRTIPEEAASAEMETAA